MAASIEEKQGKRLAVAREAAGYKNPRQAAMALGVPYQTYFAHEAGRRSYAKVASTYAKKFKASLDWLLNGVGEPPKNAQIAEVSEYDKEIAGVPLLGKIQAGLWLDISLFQQDVDIPMLPLAIDDRFPRARQYALEVAGDSMNKLFPDGSYVTLVDFAESGLKLRVGHIAHVERHRAGGQLVENTLKAVEIVDGELRLVPKSTNPAHKAFPVSGNFEDTEILVKGIVLWSNVRQEV